MVYADADGLKDLLIGEAEGRIRLYLNVNTEEDPQFDGGTYLQVGEPGLKINIDVGQRPTPILVDWNNDGKRDLVSGAKDGKLYLFINEGTDTEWDFRVMQRVQEDGADLVVPSARSSPEVLDMNNDGKKDIITGNTAGQILFYINVGSAESPAFSGYTLVEAGGVPIDLASIPRTRPFMCDWNSDSILDMVVGSGYGLVHLYLGIDPSIAVMITNIAASTVDAGVELEWEVAADEAIAGFKIHRENVVDGASMVIPSDGVLLPSSSKRYLDKEVQMGETYRYTLIAVKTNGSEVLSQQILVETRALLFALHQNYPNPFTSSTRIGFSLALEADVTLVIYDVAGRRIRTLVNRRMTAGNHIERWDGHNTVGQAVSSGIYFCRLTANKTVLTRKLIITR